ncbi:E3 ubiquitin-protein ligase RNF168 isoform X2 [Ochotona princeps]|uniref:E3 ubiquitin-protein ligase RNF168 isoform X2 n=1 Tax=Ochotona princeps TaxID=9978 RepID=UPI0027155B59|nr:E3 ubiquitin-protein ligase RNF168 isoform X2 [Ochotona princeps]
MAVPRDGVPSLSECRCGICVEILIEPVTLPCNHTLCKPCFQSTVEKANLCCPFCRRRVSSWARYHTRRKTLVNMELWEMIQRLYPKECELRASGQDTGEIAEDYQPVRLISKPGELRKEYEEEISKVEAERRANVEEENKASEEYIQRLLAEEEEEEKKQAEKRRNEMEEQLRNDEQLARRLSIDINNSSEGSILDSPLDSRKSDLVTTKSQKKNNNKQRYIGNIQKYLSPKSQLKSASWSEVIQEIRKNSTSKMCLEIQEQRAESAVESPMPCLCAYDVDECLEGEVKAEPDNQDKEQHVLSHEELKPTAPDAGEAMVKPAGHTESGCTPSALTQPNNTAEVANQDSCLLMSQAISNSEDQASALETVTEPDLCAKRRKICPKSPSGQEETNITFTQKLLDLERLLFERHKQEEQDRLLALELQKQEDQERMKPNRQKGSPGEYQLRATTSPPDKLLTGQGQNLKDRNSRRQTDKEHSKPQRGCGYENRQPPFKIQVKTPAANGRRVRNSTRDNCNISKSASSLQPSNSQKSIFQMFQKYTK